MRVAIGLMCKAPRPGFAKTRLARVIGEARAAALAAAFIRDAAARAARLAGALGGEAVALFTPDDAASELAPLLPPGMPLLPQEEGGLGERMAQGIALLLARGDVALLTGSDVPTLPAALLAEAVAEVAAGRADAGFVPVTDGGWCAAAVKAPVTALFGGMAWSTPRVMEETEAAAVREGLRLHRTAPWYDVDEAAGFARLEAEMAGQAPAGDAAPATRALLLGAR